MELLETIIAIIGIIIGPSVVIMIFLINALQRLAKVEECVDPKSGGNIARLETKVDFMLKWIAALNGDIREGKDLEKLLKQIKEVAKGKGL